MADTFKLEIVSPERLLLSQDIVSVLVPGTEGYMTALVDHMPVMTTLKAGLVEVRLADDARRSFFVRGGFADITPHMVTILAQEATAVEDIDRDELVQAITNAEEDVGDAEDGPARDLAAQRLGELREVADSLAQG